MPVEPKFTEFSTLIQELSTIGIFILDRRLNVVFWNRFMEIHSRIKSEEILNKKLTRFFPDINEAWLFKKVRHIFVLKNQTIITWKQRPYLLRLPSTQYSIDDVDFMYQNCSFFPVKNDTGTPVGVCVAIHDVTEMVITQRLLDNATEQALNLEEISIHDHLTGLFNRQYFFEQFVQDTARCRRLGWGLGLALIDADNFKDVNDSYSHQGGDKVLKEVAKRLQSTLRSSDSLCRYGGEEFVLILPNVDVKQGINVCERLRRCISQSPIVYKEHEIKMTVSIGLVISEEEKTVDYLISAADNALYRAKNNGRDRVEVFKEEAPHSPS